MSIGRSPKSAARDGCASDDENQALQRRNTASAWISSPCNGSVAIKLLGSAVIRALIARYKLGLLLNDHETLFAKSRKLALMMSGDECRAKARQSLDFAKVMPSAQLRAEWRIMARDWVRLGRKADYQDRMQGE
jgi:hypothetical protein